jgi:hypothetical protein
MCSARRVQAPGGPLRARDRPPDNVCDMSVSSPALPGAAGDSRTPPGLRDAAATTWRTHRLVIVLASALFGWLTVLGALQPLTPDEAVYRIVSTGMVHGQWPYRDLFDHKPPLAYVWYLPSALGGSIEFQRALAALMLAATVPIFAAIAHRWLTGRAATFSVIAFALMLANPGLSVRGNLEAFALLPLIAALAVPSPIAAGGLLAIAIMTKPTALLFAPMLWLIWKRDAWKSAVGAIVLCAAVSAPFAPIWRDYLTANIAFNIDYGRAAGGHDLRSLLTIPAPVLIGSLPLWCAAVAGLAGRYNARLLLLAACGLAATKLSGQQFAHYYVLLLPGAALLAGRGLDWAMSYRAGQAAIAVGALLAVAPICIGFPSLVRDYDRSRHPLAAAQAAIDATPGETYVLAGHAQPYVHAGRVPQRRFFFSVPLAVRPAWGEDVRRDLAACPPPVLITSNDAAFRVPWQDEITTLYARHIEVTDGTVWLAPVRNCDR